jgi:DUF1680 family protein
LRPGSYLRLKRTWRAGDRVRLHFPMTVRLVEAHPHVVENVGRWAVARGPIVFCVEQVDHPGVDLDGIVLPRAVAFAVEERPSLLGGLHVLTATARAETLSPDWENRLYHTADPVAPPPESRPVTVTAIPYFAWAHRDPGPMRVWLRHE